MEIIYDTFSKKNMKKAEKKAGYTLMHAVPKVLSSLLLSSFLLVGCQSTTTDVLKSTDYNTNTSPSSNREQKSPEEIAKIRTQLAGQYIKQNRLDDATRQLERVFEVYRNYAPAYDMMGVLLQKEGSDINLQKAEGYFKKAIKLDPYFMQTRNNYGVYLSHMKRYTEAAQQFEIAGSALGYDGRISALENLGRTYVKLNQKKMAIKSFMRTLDSDRSSIVARIELVDLFIETGRTGQAQSIFDELNLMVGNERLSPRLMLQGIKLAAAFGDMELRQKYAQQLLSSYPLSNEAKQLKQWLRNPRATWK